jgi:hypothetical protein
MRSLLVALLAARTVAQCPSPYQGTSIDACFLISDFPATFSQCQQHCESNGGSLATIKSKAEDDYVRQLVTTQRAVWIGLFESGEQDESGVWEWVNGMSDTWRNWQPGEPNEWCTDEDCGLLAPGLWDGWVDASCTIPNWAQCLCRRGQLAGTNYRRDRVRLDQNAHDYDDCVRARRPHTPSARPTAYSPRRRKPRRRIPTRVRAPCRISIADFA